MEANEGGKQGMSVIEELSKLSNAHIDGYLSDGYWHLTIVRKYAIIQPPQFRAWEPDEDFTPPVHFGVYTASTGMQVEYYLMRDNIGIVAEMIDRKLEAMWRDNQKSRGIIA